MTRHLGTVASSRRRSSGIVQPASGLTFSNLIFQDEFTGTSVDTTKWALHGGTMNNATSLWSNASVSGSVLTLQLSSAGTTMPGGTLGVGICMFTNTVDGWSAPSSPFTLAVGSYVEARCNFPIVPIGRDGINPEAANWPAAWTAGDPWPTRGEHDFAEVLSGALTVNYHGGPTANNDTPLGQITPSGTWLNGWHTYGVWRRAGGSGTEVQVWWDQTLVRSYQTYDNAQPESVILNIGRPNTMDIRTDITKKLQVDWVRAWN